MKSLLRLSGLLLSLFTLQSAYASDTNTIQLNKYYAASCQDYTGTWQGWITDPTDLFANGGPWPLTVSLYNKNDRMVGQTSLVKYSNNGGEISKRQIWAECKNGVLADIFWGNKGACGSYSQQGLLVSKNVLVLQLNYENSMNGTSFLVFLSRKNNTYSYPVPKNTNDLTPGAIQSCH